MLTYVQLIFNPNLSYIFILAIISALIQRNWLINFVLFFISYFTPILAKIISMVYDKSFIGMRFISLVKSASEVLMTCTIAGYYFYNFEKS